MGVNGANTYRAFFGCPRYNRRQQRVEGQGVARCLWLTLCYGFSRAQFVCFFLLLYFALYGDRRRNMPVQAPVPKKKKDEPTNPNALQKMSTALGSGINSCERGLSVTHVNDPCQRQESTTLWLLTMSLVNDGCPRRETTNMT